jgi:serine/threonine-protein kinase HipA
MRFDLLYLWYVGSPEMPKWVGTLRLNTVGRGVSLTYSPTWLTQGFPLSEDLPLIDVEHLPFSNDIAAGAADDARPDRWGERIIRLLD